MDPLITNGIELALLRGMEKGNADREPETRRKRVPVPARKENDENQIELGFDAPQHSLDDLA